MTTDIHQFFRERGISEVEAIIPDMAGVARGKIMVAAKEGRPIPEGWAVDAEGRPTTDAKAALSGAMLAMGGTKGALLALIVELLCCALTGAAFGFEADSFFQDEGNRPRLGQALLVIDPGALAGADGFAARIETLIAAMLADEGVRLPGAKRDAQEVIDRAHALLKVMDAQLATRPFLVGHGATLADIAGYSYISAAPEGNVDLAAYANVRAWLAR